MAKKDTKKEHGGRVQNQRDAQEVSTGESAPTGVDRIREIIFGDMMREYERRFQALEKELLKRSESLNETILEQFNTLSEKMDQQYHTIDEQLEKAMTELKSDKADREKLAAIFTQMADQIKK